jgi:hypothetical protein
MHDSSMRNVLFVAATVSAFLTGCARRSPTIELPHVQWLVIPVEVVESETYSPIPEADADRLGCRDGSNLPICSVGLPSVEEESAFRSEAIRLAEHPNAHCRILSRAMWRNLPQVRMYPRALVSESRGVRYYGVGHSYRSADQWQIRIARRLTELNPRPLDQKVRTFRHEVAHTLGASEERLLQWSAEEYADRCA